MIHHTAGNEKDAAALRSIFKTRFNVNYIGYSFAIFPNGTYVSDIGWDEWGIHCNTGTINNSNSPSISFVGNFTDSLPTEAALNTARNLCREFQSRYGIKLVWKSTMFGHRDMGATACPGNRLYAYLPEFINSLNDDMSKAEREELGRLRHFYNQVKSNKTNEFKKVHEATIYQIYAIPDLQHVEMLGNRDIDLRIIPDNWPIDPSLWEQERNTYKADLERAVGTNAQMATDIDILRKQIEACKNQMEELVLVNEKLKKELEGKPSEPSDHTEARGIIQKVLEYFISLISKK